MPKIAGNLTVVFVANVDKNKGYKFKMHLKRSLFSKGICSLMEMIV